MVAKGCTVAVQVGGRTVEEGGEDCKEGGCIG